MSTDHSRMKLGKLAPHPHRVKFHLADYLTDAPVVAPARVDWGKGIEDWGMMLNDGIGDCAIAGPAHLILEWTTDEAKETVRVSDEQVLAAYRAVSGYDPRDPGTDSGCVLLDVLGYWRETGIGGHRVVGSVGLEPGNVEHVKLAVDWFGGVVVGLELPVTAQTQQTWAVPHGGARGRGAPGTWGGHCVVVVGYDHRGLICVTWGRTKVMTWAFWRAYCDEAHAVLSADWAAPGKLAPSGLDLDTLRADLGIIAG